MGKAANNTCSRGTLHRPEGSGICKVVRESSVDIPLCFLKIRVETRVLLAGSGEGNNVDDVEFRANEFVDKIKAVDVNGKIQEVVSAAYGGVGGHYSAYN
jgi:hypothetical protein